MHDSGRQPRALRQLPVDLEELAMALEDGSGETNWCLDTVTGEVILVSTDIYVDVDERAQEIKADETGRYLSIRAASSNSAYQEMQDFIQTVQDARFRELLEVSIEGRGAF